MRSLRTLKVAVLTLVARMFATRIASPRMLLGQRRTEGHHNEIKAMPTKPGLSLQQLDSGGSGFLKFYFTEGYDPAGNPDDLPLRPP